MVSACERGSVWDVVLGLVMHGVGADKEREGKFGANRGRWVLVDVGGSEG